MLSDNNYDNDNKREDILYSFQHQEALGDTINWWRPRDSQCYCVFVVIWKGAKALDSFWYQLQHARTATIPLSQNETTPSKQLLQLALQFDCFFNGVCASQSIIHIE